MNLELRPYVEEVADWPSEGRHLLAQFTDDTITLYQAYRPSIAAFACENQRFGGPDFSLSRMTWVKPNFLWMMYRSGWATKPGQERVLTIDVDRDRFESWLARCVPSTYDRAAFASGEDWRRAGAGCDARLQWDPDHDPRGHPVPRKALQLGLRGDALREYAGAAIRRIADVTDLVERMRPAAVPPYAGLMVPHETTCPLRDANAARRAGLTLPNA